MRVTQIADLAGTTPRAVRHYHRLGLLEVPPTVRGRREAYFCDQGCNVLM